MEERYIYAISTNRGQKDPEIYSFWYTYEDAIKAYFQLVIDHHNCIHNFSYDFTINNYFLYAFPVNVALCENTDMSDIKMQKSCKYRIKFKSFQELQIEYERIQKGISSET